MTSQTQPNDKRNLVHLDTDIQVYYWMCHWGLSRQALMEAVQAVGKNVADVESFLFQRGYIR